jgi:hypothetical protein
MSAIVSRAALLALSLASTRCYSDGVVGMVEDCDQACEADETCDPVLGRCVEADCEGDAGCETPDECDDCASDDAACIAMLCQSCTTDGDCTGEESSCVDGRCIELDDDRDEDQAAPAGERED